jgi:spermidine/putrescine transport system substrate-binding protein
MLIPTGGDVYTASVYMNFVYDPKIAAEIAAYVNYICPVVGAKQVLAKKDPKLASNELIFPSAATLKKVKIFDSAALSNEKYIERWQRVIGA